MLTAEKLEKMKPGKIFAKGETFDDWVLLNIRWSWKPVQWIAKRWDWFHDWAIYTHIVDKWDYRNEIQIMQIWDKLYSWFARNLVWCDESALNLYRG